MKNLRFIVILVISILVLIVILQNMESVGTRILFVTITMPRAALLFVTLVIGFIAGLIVAATTRRSGRPGADRRQIRTDEAGGSEVRTDT